MIRLVAKLLAVGALVLLALPAGAMANPIADCADDGDLDKSYSNAELREAIDNLPGELEEYSNCREVFSGAIKDDSDRGGNRPASGGDGSGAAVPADEEVARRGDNADLAAITSDPEANRPDVQVGGEKVKPGSNGLFDLASASNDLPIPLLVALVALAIVALIGGLVALRERIPALARIPLLSKIPTPRVSFPRFRR